MIEYIFLAVSAFLFALMFLFNKGFQRSRGSGFDTVLTFSAYTSLASVLLMLLLCLVGSLSGLSFLSSFTLEFSWFSLLVSLGGAAVSIGYAYFGLKALGIANLSLFSIFAMLGGMLLPSVVGILFFGEALTLPKIGCYLLIIVAVSMTFDGGKQNKKALIYYFGVFVLNGMSGVVSMIHQRNTAMAVNSTSFMVLKGCVCAIICVAWFLIQFKRFPILKLRECGNISAYALCNGTGNLLLLIALLTVDGSVQFPIITGGTMFFSTVISIAAGEKPKVKTIIASLVAAASTVLMMF